ncbi:MAG: hypothetical protein WCP69_07275 [Bacteroidota bacterium]
MRNILLVIMGLILFMSCTQSNDKKAPSQTKDSTVVKPKSVDTTKAIGTLVDYTALGIDSAKVTEINDLSRFISGMTVSNGSKLKKYTKSKIWQSYANQANSAWSSFFTKNEVARKWGVSELKELQSSCFKLIYPFSGPDVLFPEIFFPQTKEVYMIGLEPVGSIPVYKDLSEIQLDTIFEKYKRSINEVIKFSFFMTKRMKVELANTDIDGTTPIIMLFLVREGKEILKIEPVTIDDNGDIIVKNSFKDVKRFNNRGVRFYYCNKGSNELRQITYFSTNLADGTLSENKQMLAFFDKMDGNIATYVKSASYLMHKSAFSTIRNTLLSKSLYHLQDDSGIPYKFFDSKKWDIQLYGSYIKPIQLFEKCLENELVSAYKDSTAKIKKLNFRIGYAAKSNLLLAKKLK